MNFPCISMIKFLVFTLILEILTTGDLNCNPPNASTLFDLEHNGIKIIRYSTIKASNLIYDVDHMIKDELNNVVKPNNNEAFKHELEEKYPNLEKEKLEKKLEKKLYQQAKLNIEANILNNINELGKYWDSVNLFLCCTKSKIIRNSSDGDTTDPIKWGKLPQKERHHGLIAVKNKSENDKGKILICFQGTSSRKSIITDLSSEWINLKKFCVDQDELKYARCFFSNGYENQDNTFHSPNKYVIKHNNALELPDKTLEKAHIHRGFFQISLSAQEEIFHLLKTNYSNLLDDYETDYVLTGHSLGAASSTIFAAPLYAFLKDNNENKTPSLNIINYGSPRVFNTTAGRIFNKQIGDDHILRVVNTYNGWNIVSTRSDPITWFPKFPLSSYWIHIPTLGISAFFMDDYMHVGTIHYIYNVPNLNLHSSATYFEHVMK